MTEEIKEQPVEQVIVINPTEQIKTLIKAGELAEETTRYDRRKSNETLIYHNEGNNQTVNPTLAEYLYRAERKIVKDMMPEIIQEASDMITDELDQVREILK
jgi:hypothetical protein